MKKIEGTATISIEQLDDLRQQEEFFSNMQRDVKGLIKNIDTEKYDKRAQQIDDMGDMPDEEFDKLIKEAAGVLQVVVSERSLRKLIHEHIDDEKSEQRYILSEMTEEEFAKIPLILESTQRQEQNGGQQDRSVCEMCEAYMADAECDMKEECPAAGIVKRLKEAEETIKEKEKIIKKAVSDVFDSLFDVGSSLFHTIYSPFLKYIHIVKYY